MNKLKKDCNSKNKGTVSKVLKGQGGIRHIASLPHKKIKKNFISLYLLIYIKSKHYGLQSL